MSKRCIRLSSENHFRAVVIINVYEKVNLCVVSFYLSALKDTQTFTSMFKLINTLFREQTLLRLKIIL